MASASNTFHISEVSGISSVFSASGISSAYGTYGVSNISSASGASKVSSIFSVSSVLRPSLSLLFQIFRPPERVWQQLGQAKALGMALCVYRDNLQISVGTEFRQELAADAAGKAEVGSAACDGDPAEIGVPSCS